MSFLSRLAIGVQVGLAALLTPAGAVAAEISPGVSPEIRAHAERMCLAEALYFEAASEGEPGLRAVAEVVFNRMKSPGWPNTICKVVYQGQFRKVCQFSFACDGARRRPRGSVLWRQAWRLAGTYIATRADVMAKATTGGATYFHTVDVDPKWEAKGLVRTVQIGRHIFYRERRPDDPPPPVPPAN